MNGYRIREVDASDEEIADIIKIFNNGANFPPLTEDELEGQNCFWWLAYCGVFPVGFTGVVPSQQWLAVGYLKRSYVDHEHRGHGLQRRFFRIRERKARTIGWTHLVSDCTDNIHSANNFIRAGYHLYEPKRPWSFKNAMYWKKAL